MSEIRENTATFNGKGGERIFYRTYINDDEKARMVVAHGLGEHSGRYGNVFDAVTKLGFSVWAPDHRGHGKSDGKRGHVMAFEEYIEDLRLLIEIAAKDRGDKKMVLLGHSMGGLIAITYALRYPETIDALVVSSPALGMVLEVPAIKEALGKFMSKAWPGLTLGNELDAQKISHDAEVVRDYINDPLVHDRVSARWFTEFSGAMETAMRNAPNLKVPVLMQVAGDDHLVNAPSSKEFFGRLAVEDRTLHVYDGNYHENYNEIEERKQTVLTDLTAWLEGHLS